MPDDIREALAAHKREIERLNGELSALSTLLFYLLDWSSRSSPNAIGDVFEAAAQHLENEAIRQGKAASPEHLVKALGIVEDLRSKIFPKAQK